MIFLRLIVLQRVVEESDMVVRTSFADISSLDFIITRLNRQALFLAGLQQQPI